MSAQSEINLAAMNWADQQGWNTPLRSTVLQNSFITSDEKILSMLPQPVLETDICMEVQIERHNKRGVIESADLLIRCRISGGCDVVVIDSEKYE